jgi:hypothetical protein
MAAPEVGAVGTPTGGEVVNRSMFRPGDWLLVVGGVAMLIFGLALDWAKVDLGGVSASGNNAFDYFFTGGIAWILVVAAGVIAVLLAVGAMAPGTTPWALILLLMTGLATLLMLLRLIIGGGDEAGIDLDRGVGMWVAFFAAAIALGGAVMNFAQSGGKFSDLTDMDKMRGAFKGGGTGSTPPPPPPGSPPPPPPSP